MADYSVNTEIRANVSNFQKGMAKAEQSLKTFSKGVSAVTKAVGALFAVKGITSFTKSISEMAGSFNEASAAIVKGTGATGKKLKELTATVTNAMRGGVGRATQEVGSMVADLNTRFGLTGEELTKLVSDFDKFNNVTGVDTTKAIEEVADVMGKWNVDTKQADYLLDQLLVASQESGASIEELTSGLKQGQAIFSKFGMNVTRSTSFLAALKKNGIDSSTAITAMKTALTNFAKSGKDAEKEFDKVSKQIRNAKSETEALKIATEVFGARAGAEMVRVLQDNGKGADDLQKKLRGAKGALKETEAASRTTKDALKDLKASVTALFSGFTGDNTLRDLVDGITSGVSKLNTEELNKSIDTFKKNLGIVLSYSAEILTTLYDNFKQIFEDISDLLDKNSEIVDKWKDNFYKSLNSLYRIVQSAFGMIQALIHGNWKMMWEYAKLVVLEIVKAIYDNMASLFQDLEDKINNVITFLKLPVAKNLPLVGELRAALEGLNLLFGKNEQTSAALGKSIEEVTNNINALATAEQNYAPIAIKDLGTQSSHIDKLSSLFKKHGKVVDAVMEKTNEATDSEANDIKSVTEEVKGFYAELVQFLQGIQDLVSDKVKSFISSIGDWINGVAEKAFEALPEWAQNTLSVMNGVFGQIGKAFNAAVKGSTRLLQGVYKGVVTYAKAYIKVISTAIKTITGLLTSGFNIFKKVLDFNLDKGLDTLLAFEDSILTFFVITLPKLPQYLKTVLQSIGSLIKSLTNSVKAENVATVLTDAIETLKTDLPGLMSDINTLLQNSIDFMTKNGANLIYNFLNVMGENVPAAVSKMLELISTTISTAVSGIIQWLNDGGLATIFNMVLDLQDKLQNLVLDLLSQIATFLTEHTGDFGDFMATSIGKAFDALPGLIDSLLKIITALIQSIADCFKNKEMVDKMVDGIVGGIEKILDNIGPLLSAVIDLIFSLIAAIVPKLPEIILKIVAAIAKALPGIVGDIANALVGGFKQIFEKIFTKDFWIDTFSAFGDALSEIATTVGKVFDVSAATGQKKSGGEVAADIGLGVLTGGMYNIVKGLGKNVFHWWAEGTDNAPAGLSVVGEAGPELVNFNGGEQVLSNRNTNKLLAGMQGGKTNNFNVVFNNVQDTSAYAMMSQLKQYNRQMAINGVI